MLILNHLKTLISKHIFGLMSLYYLKKNNEKLSVFIRSYKSVQKTIILDTEDAQNSA